MTITNRSGDNTVEKEIISTRIFNTTIENIFNAWVDPKKIIRWWGPKGFTNTFHEFNPVSGGKWSFIMHGPDGKNYPNESAFVSIHKNKEIILDHISAPKFRLTATFEEHPEGTKLIFHMLFETIEIRNALSKLIIPSNEENFDRLEKVLEM